MPDGHPDNQPVTWGRYQAAHDALEAHITALENKIITRLGALEETVSQWQNSQSATAAEHRNRVWQAALMIISGLVLPLVLIGVIALIHLIRKK